MIQVTLRGCRLIFIVNVAILFCCLLFRPLHEDFGIYHICAKTLFKRDGASSGPRCPFWYEYSSTSKLCVCEHRRLWHVCTFAQARLSLRCLLVHAINTQVTSYGSFVVDWQGTLFTNSAIFFMFKCTQSEWSYVAGHVVLIHLIGQMLTYMFLFHISNGKSVLLLWVNSTFWIWYVSVTSMCLDTWVDW